MLLLHVPSHHFVYQYGEGHWTFSTGLPPRYRGYDLFHSYKVVMNEPQPYLHFQDHRRQYAEYRAIHTGRSLYTTAVTTVTGIIGTTSTRRTRNGVMEITMTMEPP